MTLPIRGTAGPSIAAGASEAEQRITANGRPEANSVDIPNDDDPSQLPAVYRLMRPLWEKCRRFFFGTFAVHEAGELDLPKLEKESPAAYDVRKRIAALFNFYSAVVKASVGMLLQQDPKLGKDFDPILVAFWQNVNGRGQAGPVFARRLFTHAIVDGVAGIIVERRTINSTGRPSTDASTDTLPENMPYWVLVKRDEIILPFYETQGGQTVLSMLILKSVTAERRGKFGVRDVERYRVWTRGTKQVTVDVYIKERDGATPTPDGKTIETGLKEIPWSPMVAGEEITEGVVLPTHLDLVELNATHHMVNTGILSLEQLAMVPSPVRIGADPIGQIDNGDGTFTKIYPEMIFGPRHTIEAPHIDGVAEPVYWLSPDVSVLEPAQVTLDKLESAMSRQAGAFLAPEPNQVESGDAKRIKGAAQRATISSVSRAGRDCLELAMVHTAAYLSTRSRKLKTGTVELNKDFENVAMEPAAMVAYIQAVRDAGLPARILLEAWQKGGRIGPDEDLEELEGDMLAQMAQQAKEKADAERARLAAGDSAMNTSTRRKADAGSSAKKRARGARSRQNA